MTTSNKYTYYGGEKIFLEQKENDSIIELSSEEAESYGVRIKKQVWSQAYLIDTSIEAGDLNSQDTEATIFPHYVIAETQEDFLLCNGIFITFTKDVSKEDVSLIENRYKLIYQQDYSDGIKFYSVDTSNHNQLVDIVVKLNEQEDYVEYAEHDLHHIVARDDILLPKDSSYKDQWHLHGRSTVPGAVDPRSTSNCEKAWQKLGNFGSLDVVIAITDDGCKLDHVDFGPDKLAGWGYVEKKSSSSLSILSSLQQTFTHNNSAGAKPQKMFEGGAATHGTSCAAVAAASNNAKFTVGGAPGCKLFPIKWPLKNNGEYDVKDSGLMAVLEHIANKVDIISNSWNRSAVEIFSDAVKNRIIKLTKKGENCGRRGKGIVFIWSAGNNNHPLIHEGQQEIPYTRYSSSQGVWKPMKTGKRFNHPFAKIPGVMFVAALASTGQRAHYSNYGRGICVCAPSSNAHTYDRLPVKGLGITTASISFSRNNDNMIKDFGGTSSAAPLTAAIAALVISANPKLEALQVVSIIKQTASKKLNFEGYSRTPAADFDPDTSWDVSPVKPDPSWRLSTTPIFDGGKFVDIGDPDGTWSPWFGHGRVDALAAVTKALSLRP